jgi:tetratricopeptide (TPR) repeat protein
LAIIARTADTRPTVPLAEVAAELRELGLEAFDHDSAPASSLPTVLSWSLRWLTDSQRTVFALLGIAPGPDTTQHAAALTGLPDRSTRRALAALEEASLLERRPGGRYVMHDLIRAYAAITTHDLPDDVHKAALTRVVDFYLHTSFAAECLLSKDSAALLPPEPPASGVRSLPLPDAAAAMVWLDIEHPTLLSAQRAAVVLGRHHAARHLAWNLDRFRTRRGHLHNTIGQTAPDAAEQLPDPSTHDHSRDHQLFSRAVSRLGLHEQAIGHLNHALALAVRHRDVVEQAHTHRYLALAWQQQRDDRRALEHAQRALDLYRTLNQKVWEADGLNQVGWCTALLGEFDSARDHCQAALALHRHHRNPGGEATALDSLGYIAHHTGDYHQALDHYHQALTLYRTHSNNDYIPNTLDRAGHSYTAVGEHNEACRAWKEASELYRDQGRDTDAERVQQQLDDLDKPTGTG